MTATAWSGADDQLRSTVRSCHAVTGTGFVYGGLAGPDGVRLSAFIGARTHGLNGLLVRSGMGLGGKVSAGQRPETVVDYAGHSGITHDYDRPVLGEGIRSVAAVPVLVGRQTRGLLYAATRTTTPVGSRVLDALVGLARRLGDRLRVEDEIESRVRQMGVAGSSEDVRDVYRELRVIAQLVDDPAVRSRLLQATQRLVTPSTAGPDQPGELTRREIDVLAEVAVGASNRDVGDRLELATETVKAYLKSASAKLGTGNRFQAVSEARRRGLLP